MLSLDDYVYHYTERFQIIPPSHRIVAGLVSSLPYPTEKH